MEEILDMKEKLFKITEIAGIKHLLKQNLEREKETLFKELTTELKNGSYDQNKFILCNQGGHGQTTELECYFWIKLKYYKNGQPEDNHIIPTYAYVLGLCREDLDTNTVNIHQDFTKLQISKYLPRANKRGEDKTNEVERKNRNEDFYRIHYYASRSFPHATLNGDRSVKEDSAPWGYSNFISEEEAIEMSTEILDRTNPKYDPKKVASFFLQLCAYDVEMCNKK